MPLTDEGFTALRAADFWELVKADVAAQLTAVGLPSDVDWEHDIVYAYLTLAIVRQLGDLGEGQQAIYDAFRRANATGLNLDSLGEVVGVPRLPATYSQAVASLAGTSGTVVQSGKVVQDPATQARWIVTEDATIPADVVIRSEVSGAVALAPSTLQISTPVAGWTGATTADAATVGRELETDSAYRLRQQSSLASGGRNAISLRGALLALEEPTDNVFISAAIVVQNNDDEPVTINSITLDAHSVAVVIWPDTLTDAQVELIGITIDAQVPSGIATMGDEDVEVTHADGVTQTVHFAYATETPVPIDVAVTIDYTVTTEDDVTAAIEAAGVAFAATLNVGTSMRLLQFNRLLGAIAGIDTVVDLEFDSNQSDFVAGLAEILVPGVPTVAFV